MNCPERLEEFEDDDTDRERYAAYLASPEGIEAKRLEAEESARITGQPTK